MKIGIAQTNPIPGDLEGNAKQILKNAIELGEDGADIVVFGYLALSGFPLDQIGMRTEFLEKAAVTVEEIAQSLNPGPMIVLGFPEPKPDGDGWMASVAVCVGGDVVAVHRDDEDGFEGSETGCEDWGLGSLVRTAFGTIAITQGIESLISDTDLLPFGGEMLKKGKMKPDLVLNLGAEAYEIGVRAQRLREIKTFANWIGCPLVGVNLVGGNDGLVFFGESAVANSDGTLLWTGGFLIEDSAVVDLSAGVNADDEEIPEDDEFNAETVLDVLTLAVRDYVNKQRIEKAVIGLSGGIDSAVVAGVAVRALGKERVIGVGMPSRYSTDGTQNDAAVMAQNMGIQFIRVPIEPMFLAFSESLKLAFGEKIGGVTEENLQARIRGVILMAVANRFGGLVLNTGNKSESAMGYATLYGDMVGALAVIGDLTKDRVYAIAEEINAENAAIPKDILTRAPSAELRPGQKDEDSLPPYPILDAVIQGLFEDRLEPEDLVEEGLEPEIIREIAQRTANNEYKRRLAPVSIKVTSGTFGVDIRYPIVQGG